jgi:hypothetical protein
VSEEPSRNSRCARSAAPVETTSFACTSTPTCSTRSAAAGGFAARTTRRGGRHADPGIGRHARGGRTRAVTPSVRKERGYGLQRWSRQPPALASLQRRAGKMVQLRRDIPSPHATGENAMLFQYLNWRCRQVSVSWPASTMRAVIKFCRRPCCLCLRLAGDSRSMMAFRFGIRRAQTTAATFT